MKKEIVFNNGLIKVNDPVHGEITVPEPFSKIILSKEMQRLSGISQNGFSQYEFKDLVYNDRLSHSIGAFHVMSLILAKLEEILKSYNISISKNDKDIALCSMLLHDIGHGPFSHSLEVVTNYSHEKRTTDILLGNTEIGLLLTQLFGKKKVRQIASFIAEINDPDEIGKDSFTKLLKNLVSHQLDADRLDYLIRDAYYVNIPSSISLEKIISSLNVIVNSNQEYELLINNQALSSIENVLIQRYQMYRDVYLSPISVLGDELFKHLLERYRQNPKLNALPISTSFKTLATDPSISNLKDFLGMTDADFKLSFEVLSKNTLDPVVAYLANPDNLKDYILLENNISIEKIKYYLTEIFGNIDLDSTLSITSLKAKVKLYKKEEKLNIERGNKILDLTECTNLIRPQEVLENTYTFFNPNLLRIELGLSEKEFKKYESDVKKMIEDLNKKPEEFELKYIINGDNNNLLDSLMTIFTENGFKILSITEKENNDEYFDTEDLSLYEKGGSLRIRTASQKNKIKFKGTYKMPLGQGEVYSSRTEIEDTLTAPTFTSFKEKMSENNVPVDFNQILPLPILNSKTRRTDVVLEKNGVQVCMSLDRTVYTNHFQDEAMVSDKMVEIEAIGQLNNRIILNEIHSFITASMPNLIINKQSKYERGITSTLSSHKVNTTLSEAIKSYRLKHIEKK